MVFQTVFTEKSTGWLHLAHKRAMGIDPSRNLSQAPCLKNSSKTFDQSGIDEPNQAAAGVK
jgi:hypothetical protein